MPPVSLTTYIEQRLGTTVREQAVNFLAKPFTASTVREFWWYWNPVVGYALRYGCYRPMRRVLPRPLAGLLTFSLCGLVHDLLGSIGVLTGGPGPRFTMTLGFTLLGLVLLVTEAGHIRFDAVPAAGRWVIHLLLLVSCFGLAVWLTSA
jgi:hypothetical protein